MELSFATHSDAICGWYQKEPNFNNPKMQMLRLVSATIAVGSLFLTWVIRAKQSHNINFFLAISAFSLSVSLFAHLRMALTDTIVQTPLKDFRHFVVDPEKRQVYTVAKGEKTPLFGRNKILVYYTDSTNCLITFMGPASKNSIASLVEKSCGKDNVGHSSYWIDFPLGRNDFEKLTSQLQNIPCLDKRNLFC